MRVALFRIGALMDGSYYLKLKIDTRPLEKKYREGKVKRTLERGLNVPEIARGEVLVILKG